jgi:hypothetical protein
VVLEFYFFFFYEFFDFAYGEVDGVASVGKVALLDLVIYPSYEFWWNADC